MSRILAATTDKTFRPDVMPRQHRQRSFVKSAIRPQRIHAPDRSPDPRDEHHQQIHQNAVSNNNTRYPVSNCDPWTDEAITRRSAGGTGLPCDW
jgi:hypothetical protein